jgi:GT2 family glycosyltransferase
MNSGLKLATGRYVQFMNAGDEYARHDVLRDLRTVIETAQPVWMYGQVAFVSESGREIVPPPFDYEAEKAACFSRGRFPPHQGTVVSTAALRAVGGFDQSYRIVADYAVALRLSLVTDPLELPTVIARFHEGGISTTRWRDSLREFHRARVSILQPTGVAALRERLETAAQYAKMGVARMLGRHERGEW